MTIICEALAFASAQRHPKRIAYPRGQGRPDSRAASSSDDDRNRFRLGAYSTLDAIISRRVNKYIQVYGAVENALDTAIESGRTPVLTLASPRTVRFGLRLKFR